MSTATSTVRVNTTEFEHCHGRKPSGRGWWFFKVFTTTGEWNIDYPNALYSKARSEVVQFAREQDGYEVKVKA